MNCCTCKRQRWLAPINFIFSVAKLVNAMGFRNPALFELMKVKVFQECRTAPITSPQYLPQSCPTHLQVLRMSPS